jgi:HSP20 family protein
MKTKTNFDFANQFDLISEQIDAIGLFAEKIFPSGRNKSGETNQVPPVNIIQFENKISIQMAIPGCEKKDVIISIEKNILTVSCEKNHKNDNHFIKKQFFCYPFVRIFNLSDSMDKNQITSSLELGILNIEIARLSADAINVKKRTIPVG